MSNNNQPDNANPSINPQPAIIGSAEWCVEVTDEYPEHVRLAFDKVTDDGVSAFEEHIPAGEALRMGAALIAYAEYILEGS